MLHWMLAYTRFKDEPVLETRFLRAAYVVYVQDSKNLHLAQGANCNINLHVISTGIDAVPSVKGDYNAFVAQASGMSLGLSAIIPWSTNNAFDATH